jgi:hypothetical protein
MKGITMKKDTTKALRGIIKKMVSEEVSKQIKYVIKELTDPTPVDAIGKEEHQPKYTETKKYTDDPILNEVLNNTEGGISNGAPAGFEEYPTLGGGAVDSVEKLAGMQSSMQPVQDTANMPDFMKKAFSGHSAKVVKAIDNKHGTRT